jgi:putative phosphoesterase
MAALQGSDLIIHAGDIGQPSVLESLSSIAPVFAVRGNNDHGEWAEKLPEFRIVMAGDVSLCILHNVNDLEELAKDAGAVKWAAAIAGHSHRPLVETRDGVLFINPGSAGPRRFRLPITIARLEIRGHNLDAKIIEIETAVASPKVI